MPLVAAAYLAFAGGLLVGFAGAAADGAGLHAAAGALAALAAVVGGVLLARRRPAAGALHLLAAAGVLLAWARREDDVRCVRQARGRSAWHVVLDDRAEPGARVRAHLADGGCVVRLSLQVRLGTAAAGRRVRVSGEPLPAEGAVDVRVLEARLRGPGAVVLAGVPSALRDRARRRVDDLFGERAGLAAALLVAETDGLVPEVRDRFADAGLVHVLSVSGLHVAVLAAAVELLASVLRLPRRPATAAAVALTAAYVVLIGAPPAAVRSAVMLAAVAASRLLQRPTSPWASLAIGATVPLVGDVRVVAHLGYQLSVSGIAALIASAALARRWIEPEWPAWRRVAAGSLLASTVASVVTTPLVAWHFGRLSLVSPLTNLAAGPVVAVMQPTLFLALALAPTGAPARLVADAAQPMLGALDLVATAGAAVPGGALDVQPSLPVALLCGVAVVALVTAAVARFPARALLAATGALVAALWRPAVARHGLAELHLLDVGQGDAIALRSPAGRWIIVDAGRVWTGGDAGRRTVVPYVRRRGGDAVAFVLSHPHADHVGGAAAVLERLRPAAYWDPGYPEPSAVYRGSLDAARRAGVRWRRLHPLDSLVVDGLVVRVLAPDSAWVAGLRDANSASTVLLVRYGAVRFLLMGDAERPEEERLVARWGEALRADVLKVGHHGSATSSTPALVGAVRPRIALISVGTRNMYGHPSVDVVARLLDGGAQVLRTDHLGHVVVRTDGRVLHLEAAGERWTLPASSTR